MANYDRFGNLIDENGHDILDDEELVDLDEVRYVDDEDDYDEDFEPDFDFGLEYEDGYYEESFMTGDSDLMGEF